MATAGSDNHGEQSGCSRGPDAAELERLRALLVTLAEASADSDLNGRADRVIRACEQLILYFEEKSPGTNGVEAGYGPDSGHVCPLPSLDVNCDLCEPSHAAETMEQLKVGHGARSIEHKAKLAERALVFVAEHGLLPLVHELQLEGGDHFLRTLRLPRAIHTMAELALSRAHQASDSLHAS